MKKKILILCATFISIFLPTFANETDWSKDAQMQKYISNIGFKILNDNRIEKRIVFYYSSSDKRINAFARRYDKAITVQKGLTPFLDSDDEYAAILCHEIAHQIDYYEGGPFIGLNMALSPKKYEEKADKRAVDYAIKAGYNPIALIVVLNKISGQFDSDFGASHPLTSKRLAYLYEYIYTKYPEYLAHNEYKTNIYYQNFLLTSRENRAKLEKKIKNKDEKIIKVNYK